MYLVPLLLQQLTYPPIKNPSNRNPLHFPSLSTELAEEEKYKQAPSDSNDSLTNNPSSPVIDFEAVHTEAKEKLGKLKSEFHSFSSPPSSTDSNLHLTSFMNRLSSNQKKAVRAAGLLFKHQEVVLEKLDPEDVTKYMALLNKISDFFHSTEDAMGEIIESIDTIISNHLVNEQMDVTVEVIINCLLLAFSDCGTLLNEAQDMYVKLVKLCHKFHGQVEYEQVQRAIAVVAFGFYGSVTVVTQFLDGQMSALTSVYSGAKAMEYLRLCLRSRATMQTAKNDEERLNEVKISTKKIVGVLLKCHSTLKIALKKAEHGQLIKLKDQSLKVKQLCALGITEIGRAHGLSDNTSDVSDQKDGLSEATMEDDDEEDDKEEDEMMVMRVNPSR